MSTTESHTASAHRESADASTHSKVRDFPGGLARPHEVRNWAQSIESAVATRDITDVPNRAIPESRFPPLWSKESLDSPPKLPRDAGFSEKMQHRRMCDEIEKRKAHNSSVLAQREDWWVALEGSPWGSPPRWS